MKGSPSVRGAVAVAALVVSGCSEEAPETTTLYGGTAVDHGAALFRDASIAKTSFNSYTCATCHEAGAGAGSADILYPGAPLAGVVDRPSYWGGQELDLLRAINACLYYFMLKDKPWAAEDVEARAMYAYLASLPAGEAGAAPVPFTVIYPVDDVPSGDAGRGAALYPRACGSCHGEAHTGAGRLVARASVLPDQVFEEHPLGTYTDVERRLVFVEKTRHGGFVGYGGQMPPFSLETLSEAELGDLLAFFTAP